MLSKYKTLYNVINSRMADISCFQPPTAQQFLLAPPRQIYRRWIFNQIPPSTNTHTDPGG